MSAKQMRNLQAQLGQPASAAAESSEDDVASAPPPPRGFAMLAGSSEEDEESGGAQEAAAPRVEAAPEGKAKSKKQSKKKKKKQSSKERADAAAADEDEDDDALLDRLAVPCAPETPEAALPSAVLELSRAAFQPDRERRRIFGTATAGAHAAKGYRPQHELRMATRERGGFEGRSLHHRRLFIVVPEQESSESKWARPECCAKMVQADDRSGRFVICSTPEHAQARLELASVQASPRVAEIVDFLHLRPFCVEALLLLSDVSRMQGQHQGAFHYLRRAVYAVECCFDVGFSPFSCAQLNGPRPTMWPKSRLMLPEKHDMSWVGWPWLGALWGYMLGLASQGLTRTALEVCKLLLTFLLPRDPLHLFVHVDNMCLKTGEHAFLIRLGRECVMPSLPATNGLLVRLDCALPNFAYSVALALRHNMHAVANLDEVGVRSVVVADCLLPGIDSLDMELLDDERRASQPSAALIRAFLLFPGVLRPLLEALSVNLDSSPPAKSACKSTWSILLQRPPFSQHREARHKRHVVTHALIGDAYAKVAAQFWRDSSTLSWLHSCAGRLVQMFESSLFAGELSEARRSWCDAALSVDDALELDYKDFSSLELGPERKAPTCIERALGAIDELAPAPDQVRPLDEDEELERALRLSAALEVSRERQRLVAEQDRELEESLAIDQGGLASESSPGLTQLIDMGFEASAAKDALARAGEDIDVAIGFLTS